jgi:nicotinamide phosphoribosyltransferase
MQTTTTSNIKNVLRHFVPTLLCDFYKVSHMPQYLPNTEKVYSTFTPRRSLIHGIDYVVAAGFQKFVKEYLVGYFGENFFSRSKDEVVAEYSRYIKYTLGVASPETKHIADLHDLGYLPIEIKAVKEGTIVPLRTPILTIENTDSRFFWVTNYLETLLSAELWKISTSATIAYHARQILNKAALDTVGDTGFVPFQGHDFSFRGMSGLFDAESSGMGHLMSFVGTDTIPAIMGHEYYYGANIEKELVGTSIPAAEHATVMANGTDEKKTILRFLREIYPTGFVSYVSDTTDFWGVIGNILTDPEVKETIMKRDGKFVIRPDSGDPVKIICGDADATNEWAKKGLIESLWDIFGGTTTSKGFKLLDSHIGAIYGDSITLSRMQEICYRLKAKGFASINCVYGIGSYTYQYNTRDTFGFAMKATAVVVKGQEIHIVKNPKTDDGTKKSNKGGIVVMEDPKTGKIVTLDGIKLNDTNVGHNMLQTIFKNGKLTSEETLSGIRTRLGTNLQ